MREKLAHVRDHLVENKWAYISGGVGLLAGAAGVYCYGGASAAKASQNINALVNYKPTQNLTQITILVRRGHPGNIVRCKETGEVFASQNRAAELMDLSASSIANHLKGKTPHVKGYTFENLGEAV